MACDGQVKEGIQQMSTDASESCSLVVESKPSALHDVCRRIMQALKPLGYTDDDVFAVHLALEEAFHNAVEHGNKGDASKTIQIEWHIDSKRIEIGVTDQGTGFVPSDVPDPRQGDNLYRPDGRGLLLINAYMDQVTYNERGNRVDMVAGASATRWASGWRMGI